MTTALKLDLSQFFWRTSFFDQREKSHAVTRCYCLKQFPVLPQQEPVSYRDVGSAVALLRNFWRCFTHWIGGMGVLVFLLASHSVERWLQLLILCGRKVRDLQSVNWCQRSGRTARLLYLIYSGTYRSWNLYFW